MTLPLSHVPPPGAIPHLRAGELAAVSEGGGQLGHVARLVVRKDGTVTVTSRRDQKGTFKRWRMGKGELNALRFLIANTDFPALHRGPRAAYPPSAVDALDLGLAVRKGNTVRGWSNTQWKEPERPLPLFIRLQELIDRS